MYVLFIRMTFRVQLTHQRVKLNGYFYLKTLLLCDFWDGKTQPRIIFYLFNILYVSINRYVTYYIYKNEGSTCNPNSIAINYIVIPR